MSLAPEWFDGFRCDLAPWASPSENHDWMEVMPHSCPTAHPPALINANPGCWHSRRQHESCVTMETDRFWMGSNASVFRIEVHGPGDLTWMALHNLFVITFWIEIAYSQLCLLVKSHWNNRLSWRSIQVLFSLFSIVFDLTSNFFYAKAFSSVPMDLTYRQSWMLLTYWSFTLFHNNFEGLKTQKFFILLEEIC